MTTQRLHALAVLIGGELAGVLTQDPQTRFRYDQGYAARPEATPLSTSMPLSQQAFRQAKTLPWIDGLLPDNQRVRQRWARRRSPAAP